MEKYLSLSPQPFDNVRLCARERMIPWEVIGSVGRVCVGSRQDVGRGSSHLFGMDTDEKRMKPYAVETRTCRAVGVVGRDGGVGKRVVVELPENNLVVG
ncbi:hypothetical protein HAX54_014758 [Datura stramonium]|uniref:Uncharacterized protein n=1 Tax=Datura stramonium TaxID=4076 RepID=A0ABS8TRG4_DATST|nr:hypothetical protein [Datura stramonium]